MKRPKKSQDKPDSPALSAWEQFVQLLTLCYEAWHSWPLYLRIVAGVILGLIVGLLLGAIAEDDQPHEESQPAAVVAPAEAEKKPAEEKTKEPPKQTVHTHARDILHTM